MEALLFVGDRLQDVLALRRQVGIVAAHLVDHGVGHLRQEGRIEADDLAEARRAAQDHAQHILAAFVAGQHAVADQEGARAGMVGNGAVADRGSPGALRRSAPASCWMRAMMGVKASVS